MAGIEPASERIEPRMSTSVVDLLVSPETPQSTWDSTGQLLGPESPSFARLAASRAALWLYPACILRRPEGGEGRRGPRGAMLCSLRADDR